MVIPHRKEEAMDVKGVNSTSYAEMRLDKQQTSSEEATKTQNTEASRQENPEVKKQGDAPLSKEEQQLRMKRLQDTLKHHNIEISYNDEVNRYAIKVLDSKSKEVVKEIPSEKSLEMFAKMLEIEGLLVDEKR